jgi:YfiH family protein
MPLPVALESSLLRSLGFRHGFATRALDFGSVRTAAERAEHAHTLGLLLRFDDARLFVASQVHGAGVLAAGGAPSEVARQDADALVAFERGDAVGVRVADCVPILLADPTTGAVAAVHAGWRGLVAGVIGAAVARATEGGARLAAAAVGPCIGACCFEVDHDVAERIAAATDARAIARRTEGKSWVDLRAAVRVALSRAGIADVDDVGGCTKCSPEVYFSHRRDAAQAGRHLAVIVAGRG